MADPAALVEDGVRHYGRFAARPVKVNPLEEFSSPARALRQVRLKEWIGFTLIHPDLYCSLIMQDAHYLASSEIYAYDRRAGRLCQHQANARGGTLALPADLSGSHCVFRRPGYELQYDFAAGDGQPERAHTSQAGRREARRHIVRIDIAATGSAPTLQGELTLDADRASAPLSVSSRLPGGRMYTHKAIFPAEGTLQVGDEKVTFDGKRDIAILDEHKSLFPYQTSWLWGTFALHVPEGRGGGLAGANFCSRQSSPGAEEESCIWTPAGCEPLSEVTFEPQSSEELAPWRVRSADGRLDVLFEPEGRKHVQHQLGIFAVDYFQLFGNYRGTLNGHLAVDAVHGVCESMRARL
jgi:Protein of unknown function (DUF2804)